MLHYARRWSSMPGSGRTEHYCLFPAAAACREADAHTAQPSLQAHTDELPPPPAARPAGSGLRNMVEVDPASGTVYLNAAVVPRVRRLPLPADGGAASGTSTGGGAAAGDTIPCHHFLVVELRHGVVAAARDAWVGVQHAGSDSSGGGAGGSRRCIVVREQELLKTSLPPAETPGGPEAAAATGRALQGAADGISSSRAAAGLAEDCGNGSSTGSYVCSIYRAHTGEWEPFVLQLPAAAAAVAAPERQLAEVS